MDEDPEPSELGTKEYWDQAYKLEIDNFKSHGDIGECWFGEDSATRIVRWLNSNDAVDQTSKIIDIGSGNGMLLTLLAEDDYENLLGVDYSAAAVELAESIAQKMGLNISYKVWDILGESACPGSPPFDVALDKGTFDAIGLSKSGKKDRKIYVDKIHSILQPGGLLVITSCNYTEAELVSDFGEKFQKISRIPAPTYKFKGQEGSLVTALIFKSI